LVEPVFRALPLINLPRDAIQLHGGREVKAMREGIVAVVELAVRGSVELLVAFVVERVVAAEGFVDEFFQVLLVLMVV